jgi:5-methylcytosine-specific restriction enzyme A
MAKLSSPKPALAAPTSKLLAPTAPQQRERYRADTEPWRKWYRIKRWYELRWAILLEAEFTCQWIGCNYSTADTSKLIAHHKIRHRGDERLFWDKSNLMCVCKDCHDGPIKEFELTASVRGCGVDGSPIDAKHHWRST